MFFGSNLQFLRRQNGITQEQLAQQMNVSRQTVSKWESGQTPEVSKLLELSDLLRCPLDDLLRQDLSIQSSTVRYVHVKGFSMARYCLISPNAEADLRFLLDTWAANSGLENAPYLSWGFPYVSPELKTRFGLTGFEAAYVLPDHFHPAVPGPTVTSQPDCDYALLSLPEPAGRNPRRIAAAIQTILEHLRQSGIPKSVQEGTLPCFEYRYTKDGTPWVDILLQCQNVPTPERYVFPESKKGFPRGEAVKNL